MILSKAKLVKGAAAAGAMARILLQSADRDAGHSLVWTLFGDQSDRTRDFLYREIEAGEYVTLSSRPPTDPANMWSIESRSLDPDLEVGDIVRFKLRANPAQTYLPAGPRGRRGIRTDAILHAKRPRSERGDTPFTSDDEARAALSWLYMREARLGLTFHRESCSAGGYHVRSLQPAGSRKPVRFGVIDYEGVATVTNPDLLNAALISGIGKAKAYGCGLLMIRRA